jgi:HAMP domain-containing protein
MDTTRPTCFACAYFAGLNDDGYSGVCIRPGNQPVIPAPEQGCVFLERNPKATEGVQTCEEWLVRYGMPIQGYTDRRKPFRSPLTPAQIRTAWERNRSDEVRLLAWEVGRLRDIIERAIAALEILSRLDVPEYWRRYMLLLIKLLKIDLGPDK